MRSSVHKASMAPGAWPAVLLTLLLGVRAASAGSSTIGARGRNAAWQQAKARRGAMARIHRQQPPLEDPEELLAERDDLRAQLATKNREFLAQHRRADSLLMKVRELERELKSEDGRLHVEEQLLKTEEQKEKALKIRLDRVRAALADDTNSTASAVLKGIVSTGTKILKTTQNMQLGPRARSSAAQVERKKSAPLVPLKDKESREVAHRAPVALPPTKAPTRVPELQQKNITLDFVRLAVPAKAGEAITDTVVSQNTTVLEPRDANEGSISHDADTFSDLEKQLREEDKKIEQLDKIDQEEDAIDAHPLAVSAIAVSSSLKDVRAEGPNEGSGRSIASTPLSGPEADFDMSSLDSDPDVEGDAAFLNSLVQP